MRQTDRVKITRAGWQPVQALSLLVGLIYLALGVVGFIHTGMSDFAGTSHASFYGFTVNPLHNVVHLAVGVLGLLMALSSGVARLYGVVLFLAFGALFAWGLAIVGTLSDNPVAEVGNPLHLNASDNWLHLGTAIAGLLIAVLPARKTAKVIPSTDPADTEDMSDRRDAAPTAGTPAHDAPRRGLRRFLPRQPRGDGPRHTTGSA